jgi:hypothetical protein
MHAVLFIATNQDDTPASFVRQLYTLLVNRQCYMLKKSGLMLSIKRVFVEKKVGGLSYEGW